MSKPAQRIWSDVVEPTTCAVSCSLSAAGNASRIWRAASPGEVDCKREIPGGLRVASLGFNRRFSIPPPPMRCMSSESVLDIFSPSLHGVQLYTLFSECSSGFFPRLWHLTLSLGGGPQGKKLRTTQKRALWAVRLQAFVALVGFQGLVLKRCLKTSTHS